MHGGGRLGKLKVAFQGWLEGYHLRDSELRKMPDDAKKAIAGRAVQLNRFHEYFTEEFSELLSAWMNTKRWGMPFSGGWAEQPARVLDVFAAFEGLFSEWESKEAKSGDKRRA